MAGVTTRMGLGIGVVDLYFARPQKLRGELAELLILGYAILSGIENKNLA